MCQLGNSVKLSAPKDKSCEIQHSYLVNPQVVGYQIAVHNKCYCNEMISLHNRHLIDRSYIQFDATYYNKHCKTYLKHQFSCDRISYREVVNLYKGGKRRIYERARSEVLASGLRKTDANVQMFIKQEKIAVDEIYEKSPRAIQYRSSRYNLVLASYLKPLETEFNAKLGLGPSQTKVVTKGLNGAELAELFLYKSSFFSEPIYLECDHKKFDSTIRVEHLLSEHKVYNNHYKDWELRQMLKKQIKNKCFTKRGIKYSVNGTRMSGDFNTSLGNCILNRLVLESFVGHVKHELMVDGDDSVIIIEKNDYHTLDLVHFERMGFETTVKFRTNINDVVYCRKKLVNCDQPVFVRDPLRMLSNMALCLIRYQPNSYMNWVAGVFDCERISNSGIPIFSSLPDLKVKRIKDQDYYRKMLPCDARCSKEQLAETWQLEVSTVEYIDKQVQRYFGFNNTGILRFVAKTANNKEQTVKNASTTLFTKHQTNISSRYATLCTTVSECWRTFGKTDIQPDEATWHGPKPSNNKTAKLYKKTKNKTRAHYSPEHGCWDWNGDSD